MRKKIAIVGTVGLPAKYGGFETLAENLVKRKGDVFDFSVYCSKKAYPKGDEKEVNATLKYIPLDANGIQSIPYDIWSLLHALRKTDSVLLLGVSGAIALPLVKMFSKKKIITNIDGLEWKRDKWGKSARRFLKFSEKLAVRYSDVVVADNKVIQEYIHSEYGKKAELIAYGADHTNVAILKDETLTEFPFLKNKYAFKVCRIEQENNIELILRAFAKHEDLNLVLVGNWSINEFAKKLYMEYAKYKNIYLLDPIYNQEKLNQLRSNCYVYIHGHSAGGTNPSLVEAMYLGLPILAYGVNYNQETTGNKALYFENMESLISQLEILNLSSMEEIGAELGRFARKNYTWESVSSKYARLF